MNRRNFIGHSGTLLAGMLLPVPLPATPSKSSYKMGLQLYTIRDAMAEDPLGSLKRVRSLGYEDLELYGFDGEKGTYYGFESREFKNILEDAELTTSSCHYGLPAFFDKPQAELFRYVDQCIKGAHILGQRYITWPFLDPPFRNPDGFRRLAALLNQVGERVTASGLGFAYHNHGFDFEDHNGITGYEIVLEQTDPALVKLQLDLYWVAHDSKLTASQWIDRFPGRFVMWHIKDMHRESRDYTELGNGSIDFHPILPEAKRSGLEFYYLEQGGNYAVNSMQSITDSASYFKKHLQKYL